MGGSSPTVLPVGHHAPPRRAAVVGAGVAGLQAARALRTRAGLEVVIFERAPDVGGVWRENYAGFGAQVPREQYHFPELAQGKHSLDWYPTGPQLEEQCQAYVDAFGLRPLLQLGQEVTRLLRLPGGRWRVLSRRSGAVSATPAARGGGEREEDFDFVVLALGNFSTKFVPQVPGIETFEGLQLHSSELLDASVLDGRRVAVVGGGKSALDCFAVAAARAASTTLLSRTPAWVLPQRFCGLPLRWLAATRWFAALVFPPYYDAGPLRRLLGLLLAPLQWLIWLILAPLLWLHVRPPRALWPIVDLRWQLWHVHSVSICDARALRAAFGKPGAECVRGTISHVEGSGIVVEDVLQGAHRRLPVDCIVFATGYREAWSRLFDEETQRLLDPRGEGPELYRQVLPSAELPGLAFVGRAVSTSDILTSFVQAEWLAAFIAGRIPWPSAKARAAAAERHRAWRRRFLPTTPSTFIATPRLHEYLDELIGDLRPRGLCCGPAACCRALLSWVLPLRPADYAAAVLPGAGSAGSRPSPKAGRCPCWVLAYSPASPSRGRVAA